MDLIPLDATYLANGLVDGYDSLIWTERLNTHGEFQLVATTDIQGIMTKLPLESFVSHRQTREVMLVETHEIKDNDDGVPQLTVSGRSWECILEDKAATRFQGAHGIPDYKDTTVASTPNDMIIKLLRRAGVQVTSPEPVSSFSTVVDEYIPNVASLDTIASPPSSINWDDSIIDYAWPRIAPILDRWNWGLKNVRPATSATPMQVTLYAGTDKTLSVIFKRADGHLLSPSYLFSKKAYKNIGMLLIDYDSNIGDLSAYGIPDPGTGTGVKRRMLLIQAPDIKMGAGGAFPAIGLMDNAIDEALVGHRQTTWMDFEVSPDIPFVYNTHYSLGDKIRVIGDYGVDLTMRVTEHIRIEDVEGERAYPTVVLPTT